MSDGFREVSADVSLAKTRQKEQLTSDPPEKFVDLYGKKFNDNKNSIMAEMGIPAENYSELSSDQQEKIAEQAEEPIITEWLDNPASNLAEAYPPIDAAADFAVLFNRRHARMAKKLDDGSKIDLIHVTHKTITEPFLVSGVLIRKSDNQKITKLAQLGGSLEILAGWESEFSTDSEGKGETIVRFRGKEYIIDNTRLDELVKKGIERSKDKSANGRQITDSQ